MDAFANGFLFGVLFAAGIIFGAMLLYSMWRDR